MNAPRPPTPDSADDQSLRQNLRDALTRSPADGLETLESRTLEQWRLRGFTVRHNPSGTFAVLQAGWRQHPAMWSGALLALALAALLVLKPWTPPEPGIDELMQPDVLSLMALGEL